MLNDETPDTSRPMRRPKLDHQAPTVCFSKELLDRIEALVGTKQRAIFIREAVEARVDYIGNLSPQTKPKR